MSWIVRVEAIEKGFSLHTQGGVHIPVLRRMSFEVAPKEVLVLVGPSGAGKSTLLKLIYGNYRIEAGRVEVRHGGERLDVGALSFREMIALRKEGVGYVSQFLRVIPRVSALEVVKEPMRARGVSEAASEERAQTLLSRLRIPERLWNLSPTTFSGGEQQRINIARGFAIFYPVMLLDEPTASLDPVNTETVCELVEEARKEGTAFIGIFHDAGVRERVATRRLVLEAVGQGDESRNL